MSKFHVIIPARFSSSRLPGKVLLPLNGKPMLEHVYRIAQAAGAQSVTVATDDPRIVEACKRFGAPVELTSDTHQSGSDRIAQCARLLGFDDQDIVVNLQGDEPLTPAATLNEAATTLANHELASMATLATPITDFEQLSNPNTVKVVLDGTGYALYFSRSPIPYRRDGLDGSSIPSQYLRHIGIYAYRMDFLQEITARAPSEAEQAEKLEQLRALHYGAKIAVALTPHPVSAGVDTHADLARVESALNRLSQDA